MVAGALPRNVELRPMTEEDVRPVLEIIRQHDEREFELAKEVYEEGGLEDQYVLKQDGAVKGVTGFEYIDGTDGSFWLTLTYVDRPLRGQGLINIIIEELLSVLREIGARKVFVNTSDLSDSRQGAKYSEERQCYESLGFKLELNYKDYYQPGEGRLTYARRVGILYGSRPVFEPDTRGVKLLDVCEIGDSRGAYFVEWEYTDDEGIFGVDDVNTAMRRAKSQGARCVFIGFPSNLPEVDAILKGSGFRECGRLVDFYEDGIDEVHYRIDLQPS